LPQTGLILRRSILFANLLTHCGPGDVSVKNLVKFLKDEYGAELAEYAVGTAILVAIALVVYTVLGDAINNKMNLVANEIDQ
jgi:Flp pilus assembly pilin Flp